MARLLDMGLDKLQNMLLDMAQLAEKTVSISLEAYSKNRDLREQIFQESEKLRTLQDEVSELAVELMARFQPVATDLRFIKSCMEISYGFSRLGRYAFDIAEALSEFGDLSSCDHSAVEEAGRKTRDMIHASIQAFRNKDAELARKVPEKDDEIDSLYKSFLRKILTAHTPDLKCALSSTLILRYLERMADHASYIAESVLYIMLGERSNRK